MNGGLGGKKKKKKRKDRGGEQMPDFGDDDDDAGGGKAEARAMPSRSRRRIGSANRWGSSRCVDRVEFAA